MKDDSGTSNEIGVNWWNGGIFLPIRLATILKFILFWLEKSTEKWVLSYTVQDILNCWYFYKVIWHEFTTLLKDNLFLKILIFISLKYHTLLLEKAIFIKNAYVYEHICFKYKMYVLYK